MQLVRIKGSRSQPETVGLSTLVSTVREIAVRCPLAPSGRGQGEGAESASVISRTVLSVVIQPLGWQYVGG
jgi:hypothetical protein